MVEKAADRLFLRPNNMNKEKERREKRGDTSTQASFLEKAEKKMERNKKKKSQNTVFLEIT